MLGHAGHESADAGPEGSGGAVVSAERGEGQAAGVSVDSANNGEFDALGRITAVATNGGNRSSQMNMWS